MNRLFRVWPTTSNTILLHRGASSTTQAWQAMMNNLLTQLYKADLKLPDKQGPPPQQRLPIHLHRIINTLHATRYCACSNSRPLSHIQCQLQLSQALHCNWRHLIQQTCQICSDPHRSRCLHDRGHILWGNNCSVTADSD